MLRAGPDEGKKAFSQQGVNYSNLATFKVLYQPESSTSKETVFSVPVLVENAADQQMDRSWINSCKKVVAGIEVIVKGGRNRLEESIVQLFDGWL